jgi:hypothetical protein
MIYNLEPVDRTIGTIIRNLGLGTEEIRNQDFIEWIADGLEHIGSFAQFETKEKPIQIYNYNGELPCDVMEVIRLKGGCEMPDDNIVEFHAFSLQQELSNLEAEFVKQLESYNAIDDLGTIPGDTKDGGLGLTEAKLQKIKELGYSFHDLPYETQHHSKVGLLKPLPGKSYPMMRYNPNLIGNIEANKITDGDYNIVHNKLTVGFKFGIIMIQYLALPVDERGYPKVPANVSFREALFWKVAYHMSIASPNKLQNPALQNPEYCYNKWSYYCRQARAEANAPDPMLEGQIANNFLRLMNNLNEQNQDYRGLNLPQSLDFNGRI